MYLAEIAATNFRVFGESQSEDDLEGIASAEPLRLRLRNGMNILVGENDSGKSAIIDAIRLCLSTTSNEFNRVTIDDFHCRGGVQAQSFSITCRFEDLTREEEGAFLEMLTPEAGRSVLYVTLNATHLVDLGPTRIAVVVRSGRDGEGPAVEGHAREVLRATYLRPLRDAESELSPGRASRLSQILASYPQMRGQERNDFDAIEDSAETLVGILMRTAHHLQKNSAIAEAESDLNKNYLSRFQIGNDVLGSGIGVLSDTSLRGVLERLELGYTEDVVAGRKTRRGLGYNNALFMAAELLLLGSRPGALLLIEEPEAHLHPQLQARVMDLLVEKAEMTDGVQVVLTTHSPNIASAASVENLQLVSTGRTFSLDSAETLLDQSDYNFLRRFLDVTKANLFFARGVAIVEGDAEALLLPALADAVGASFSRDGISVVNVGHVGLFRYSRIFQRRDGSSLPVRVACFRDRDVAPAGTPDDMAKKLKRAESLSVKDLEDHCAGLRDRDGGAVKTFVSDHWTLEYDLAVSSWKTATMMHMAVQAAVLSNRSWPTDAQLHETFHEALLAVDAWRVSNRDLATVGLDIYRPLRMNEASKAITAQYAALLASQFGLQASDLPKYMQEAFEYLQATSSDVS